MTIGRRMAPPVLAAVLLLLAGAVSLEAQPVQFGIIPGELELVPAPGGTATATLVVINHSPRRVRFTVKVQDAYLRPSGELSLLDGVKLAGSVARHSRVAPAEFDLDPNTQMPVRVTVTVPADARGELFGAVVVSPTPILQTDRRLGTISIFVPKLAARLLVPVRGTEVVRGAIINMLAAPRPGGTGAEIKVVFRNSGNVHVRVSGGLVVLDPQGQQAGRLPIPEALVLPGSLREFKLTWDAKRLPPGTYTIRAVMDYGADELIAGEVGFTYRRP